MQKCSNCHKILGDDVIFCPYCGQKIFRPVELVCPCCGVSYKDKDVRFCGQCGSELVNRGSLTNSAQKDVHSLDDLVKVLNKIACSRDEKIEVITKDELVTFSEIKDNANDKERYLTYYKPKKRKGRYRVISSPTPRLKLILRCLNDFLQTIYTPRKYVTGFVKKTSIVDNGKIHVGQRYVFTIDLMDFFESVKLNVIEECLHQAPFHFNNTIAHTIAAISCVKNEKNGRLCLSQGSPLSPILSNIVCVEMDKKLSGLASFYRVKYSRYADDITFSSHSNIFNEDSDFARSVRQVIKSNNFRINENKVHVYGPQSCHYVTGIVTNEKVNIPRYYIRSIRNMLYIWERYGINEAYKKLDEIYQKKHRGRATPFIGDYLRGQINFLGTVRGKEDPIFLRFQSKLNTLIAIPFKPFCGRYDESSRRFLKKNGIYGYVYWYLSTIMRYGKKYYTTSCPGIKSLLISPKLYEYIESGVHSDFDLNCELYQHCVYYRIFDKDGVKVLMSIRK